MRSTVAAALLLAWAGPAEAADRLVLVKGHWAAFTQGRAGGCHAVARPELRAPKGKLQPYFTVRFDRSGTKRGEIALQLRRRTRPGSSIILTVGAQSFQLFARESLAWSSGPRQEAAIIAAMRSATAMRVSARDLAGRRFTDRYLLAGAPTAIDAAAAECSLR